MSGEVFSWSDFSPELKGIDTKKPQTTKFIHILSVLRGKGAKFLYHNYLSRYNIEVMPNFDLTIFLSSFQFIPEVAIGEYLQWRHPRNRYPHVWFEPATFSDKHHESAKAARPRVGMFLLP